MSVWKRIAGAGIAIAMIAAIALTQKVPDRYTAVLNRRLPLLRDERLTFFFGECQPAGYGYLKRVLRAYSRIESVSVEKTESFVTEITTADRNTYSSPRV
jgi:hypothetical protein